MGASEASTADSVNQDNFPYPVGDKGLAKGLTLRIDPYLETYPELVSIQRAKNASSVNVWRDSDLTSILHRRVSTRLPHMTAPTWPVQLGANDTVRSAPVTGEIGSDGQPQLTTAASPGAIRTASSTMSSAKPTFCCPSSFPAPPAQEI
jgi:hypothetical protein